nr:SMI1/KNR4 family protein [uncultured Erythrobacter sp.]
MTEAALVMAEQELGSELPRSYKSAILRAGLPSPTIELLDFICDHEIDLPDLSDFHSPEDIASSTIDWREMGMPEHLIAFASDCSGNLFAFPTSTTGNRDEVWFFDHDFGTSDKLADSFEDWLNLYNSLKN